MRTVSVLIYGPRSCGWGFQISGGETKFTLERETTRLDCGHGGTFLLTSEDFPPPPAVSLTRTTQCRADASCDGAATVDGRDDGRADCGRHGRGEGRPPPPLPSGRRRRRVLRRTARTCPQRQGGSPSSLVFVSSFHRIDLQVLCSSAKSRRSSWFDLLVSMAPLFLWMGTDRFVRLVSIPLVGRARTKTAASSSVNRVVGYGVCPNRPPESLTLSPSSTLSRRIERTKNLK